MKGRDVTGTFPDFREQSKRRDTLIGGILSGSSAAVCQATTIDGDLRDGSRVRDGQYRTSGLNTDEVEATPNATCGGGSRLVIQVVGKLLKDSRRADDSSSVPLAATREQATRGKKKSLPRHHPLRHCLPASPSFPLCDRCSERSPFESIWT